MKRIINRAFHFHFQSISGTSMSLLGIISKSFLQNGHMVEENKPLPCLCKEMCSVSSLQTRSIKLQETLEEGEESLFIAGLIKLSASQRPLHICVWEPTLECDKTWLPFVSFTIIRGGLHPQIVAHKRGGCLKPKSLMVFLLI